MDPLKAPIVATLLCLCFVRALCDAAPASPSPEQEQEIQMLRSKVASLEDEISRRKEETSELESVVRERTAQMAELVGDIELFQKVNLGDDESVMKPNTHDAMLEKQIERQGKDLEDQIRKGQSLEGRAIEAERSLHEFGRKLEHAENINIEQKKKIQDLSNRLEYAEDKLSLLENEAKSKEEELAKAHGMWLHHWLAVRVLRCQATSTFVYLCPVVLRVCWAYLSRIVAESEPHLSGASVVLKPYMRPAASAWISLVSFTSEYHNQVQNGVKRFLQGNQLPLSPLSVSAGNLAWIKAPALLVLPVLCIYKMVSAIVRRKNQARKDRLQRQARSRSRRRKQERGVDR